MVTPLAYLPLLFGAFAYGKVCPVHEHAGAGSGNFNKLEMTFGNKNRSMEFDFNRMTSGLGLECLSRDIFVHYHDDESDLVRNHLLPKLEQLSGRTVRSKENIPPGASYLEEISKMVVYSGAIVLVLSSSFLQDNLCRFITSLICNYYKLCIAVLITSSLLLDLLAKDFLYKRLITVNGYIPFDISKCTERFWPVLKSQLTNGGSIYDTNNDAHSRFEIPSVSSSQSLYVHYHDQDKDFVDNLLLPMLKEAIPGVSITTSDDILPGENVQEKLSEYLSTNSRVLLVISDSFLSDTDCRRVAASANAYRSRAVVQIDTSVLRRRWSMDWMVSMHAESKYSGNTMEWW